MAQRAAARTGAPEGTPAIDTNPGLTPQMPIVNGDGTPTNFFFRWLLSWRQMQQAAQSGISVNGDLVGNVSNGPITVNGNPV